MNILYVKLIGFIKSVHILEDSEHGVFATRSPCRPNPIGLPIVRLIKGDRSVLSIQGIDILDGTPVLNIKHYSSLFDCFPDARNGWQKAVISKDTAKRGKRGYRVMQERKKSHENSHCQR